MKYLIMGRSGTGKDTLAKELKTYGLKEVLSYTTRPKRTPDENTHTFITSDMADDFPDKVASTTINGYDYFATKQQVEEADFYVIDPNGLKVLSKMMPETSFHIIYVKSDSKKCKEMAVTRSMDPEKESAIYDSRRADEDAQFSEFEKLLEVEDALPQNCSVVQIVENDYKESTLRRWADYFIRSKWTFDHLTDIVKYCAEHGILEQTNPEHIPDELFVDILLLSPEAFSGIVQEYWLFSCM